MAIIQKNIMKECKLSRSVSQNNQIACSYLFTSLKMGIRGVICF